MFLIGILLCISVIPMAFGQVITGDIIGTVTDPSGAAIPGAAVTVTNAGTQLTRKAETNTLGDYTFTLLPTGTYSVSIEAKGFKTYKLAEMSLLSAQRARVNARLEVGNLTETVEVSAAEPLLQTDSSSVSTTLTSETVAEIPLNGRNFIDLITIQPGVNAGTPGSIQSGARPDERRQSSSFSANGQLESRNSQMLDGMDNSERYYGLVMIRPSIDGIAEMRVDTNAFSAESGVREERWSICSPNREPINSMARCSSSSATTNSMRRSFSIAWPENRSRSTGRISLAAASAGQLSRTGPFSFSISSSIGLCGGLLRGC